MIHIHFCTAYSYSLLASLLAVTVFFSLLVSLKRIQAHLLSSVKNLVCNCDIFVLYFSYSPIVI